MQCLDEILYLYFTALEMTTMLLVMDLSKIPMHLLLCHLLIAKWEMGIKGVALAMGVVYFLKLIVIKIVVDSQKQHSEVLRESLFVNFGSESLAGFKEFMTLASAGLALSCVEWWISEALTILAGYISVQALDAAVIVNTISLLLSHITMGFSFTLSAMIGSALGKGDVKGARQTAVIASSICYFYVVVSVALCICFSHQIASFFSND